MNRTEYKRNYHREWKRKYPEKWLEHQRKYNNSPKGKACRDRWKAKLRLEIMKHYSQDNVPSCCCCGEKTMEFLTIDHINGRKMLLQSQKGLKGIKLYCWLRQNNFPSGFQVLCANCNLAKGVYGICPHQIDVDEKKVVEEVLKWKSKQQ